MHHVAVGGGGLIEFRLRDHALNPLNWRVTPDLEPPVTAGKPYLQGHFLCLDRWGPPSEAELARITQAEITSKKEMQLFLKNEHGVGHFQAQTIIKAFLAD